MSTNHGTDKNVFVARLTLGGTDVDSNDVIDVSVSSQIDQPDALSVHLGNTTATRALVAQLKLGDPVQMGTVHSGDPKDDMAFVGEITGIEPMLAASGETRGHVQIHGLNGLHAMTRGKRSCAYSRLPSSTITFKDILDDLIKRYPGIIDSVDYGDGKQPPSIEHKHIYQHNQTDLEFIRHRAARLGYYVLVRDKKLLFQERTATVSPITLVLDKKRTVDGGSSGDGQVQIAMNHFVPKVSTANQFSTVRVRAFNPSTRAEMICTYPKGSDTSLYGSGTDGTAATQEMHKDAPVVRVDVPFETTEEGDALAKAIAMERRLNYITVEGSVPGDPRLKPGMVVTVQTGSSAAAGQGKYNVDGKYFVTGVVHWYRSKGKTPYTTDFQAQRDATDSSGSSSDSDSGSSS